MAKQSKNRVKLNKQYKSIGKIPLAAINKISEFMDLPTVVRDIRSSKNNMVKHNHRHIDELEEQLNQLGITKEGYAEFVAKNYNQIRLGNRPLSLVLAVLLENINHIAAVHLHYDKTRTSGLSPLFMPSRCATLKRSRSFGKGNEKRGARPLSFFLQSPLLRGCLPQPVC